MITLTIDGVEQELAAWGIADPVLTHTSQQRSTMEVRVLGGDLTQDPIAEYYGQVTFKKDGVTIFNGRQVTDTREATPGNPSNPLTFACAWYELENLPFQQLWTYAIVEPPSMATRRFSRYNLFQKYATGGFLNNGDQIREILEYAIRCGVNIQVGTIDPATTMPFYPARAMMCSEAIVMCLKPCPDAVTYIDHATTPPTFHCRLRRNLGGVTMPYAGTIPGPGGGQVQHQSSKITPRPDLQVPEVVIDYQKHVTVTIGEETASWTSFAMDAYPPGSNGETVGAIVLPIDLRDANLTKLQATVKSKAFAPTGLDFWKEKKQELNDPKVDSLAILGAFGDATHPIKVIDEDGADIDLTEYPYEWVDGAINPWMSFDGAPVKLKEATVSADLSWKEYDSAESFKSVVRDAKSHKVTVRIKLTNSPPDSDPYTVTASEDSGDSAPPDLAKNIYDSAAQLHYEGTHVVLERFETVSSIIGPWLVLNLTGGAAAWAGMRATIQSASHEFFSGKTTINIGPPKQVAPADLAEMLIWARFRVVWDNPSLRTTGKADGGGGSASEVAKNTPKENTTHGLEDLQKWVLTYIQST